ncbi:hypothetical protein ACH5RR_024185 [Cinchona calisaya]|uniref:Non-specific lipid-transfer protein n=1 Tax=Cinchona calisaya TaxID=153742 RepID=A0ABD2ZDW9_9GENT
MARLVVLGLFAMVVAIISTSRPAVAVGSIPCSLVNSKLLTCVPYIANKTDKPTSVCCEGVQEISNLAKSNADLIAVCSCIKADLPNLGHTTPARIAGLPKKCGIKKAFPPVDSNYDCNKLMVFGLFALILVAIISTSMPAVVVGNHVACSLIKSQMRICMPYINGRADKPDSRCCEGIQKICSFSNSKGGQTRVCVCIKSDLPSLGYTIPARIADIPKRCGVNRYFPPVSPYYNCFK